MRIRTGETERIEITMLDGALAPLTGLANVLLSIRRIDGWFFDFADLTFKASGWTTLQQVMGETDNVNDQGNYHYDFNTSTITNPAANDTYAVRADCVSAANTPQNGELKVGQFVDHIDEAISSRSSHSAQNVENLILSDGVAFPGANIDASITSRQSEADAASRAIADQGEHTVTQSTVTGLNDLSQTDVQTAMISQGYTVARSTNLDNLDTSVLSRESELNAASRASSDITQHGVTQSNIGSLNDLSTLDMQAAMTSQGYTTPRATNLDNLNAMISSRAQVGDEMDLMTDAIDANAIAASGVNEIRDSILSDSVAFNGASMAEILADTNSLDTVKITTARASNLDNLNATVSSRATQTDILSDATPFAGTNVDVAVSSRSSHSEVDVDTRLSSAHGSGSWDSTSSSVDVDAIASAVWDKNISLHTDPSSAGEAQNHLDVSVSTRSVPGDAMDLINDAVDSNALATTAVDEVRDAILLDGTPFAGSNIGTILLDTADMRPKINNITDKLPNNNMMGSSNKLDWNDDIEIIYNSVLELNDTKITTARANNLDNLNAQITSRSSHDAADINTVLGNNHGSGQWDAIASIDEDSIVEKVWDKDITLHALVNSAGEAQNRVATILNDTAEIQPKVDSIYNKLPNNNIMGSSVKSDVDDEISSIVHDVAELNDVKLTSVRVGNLDNIDVPTSTRSSHSQGDVDILLSNNHGIGQWDSTANPLDIADAVWDEQLSEHTDAGSASEILSDNNTLSESIENIVNHLNSTLTLLRKILSNKTVLTKIDVEHYQQKFYDDDGSTIIKMDNLSLSGNDEIREPE